MLDLERLHSYPAQYLEELRTNVDKYPGDLESLQTLAEARFELGDAEIALPLIQKAIEIDPEGKAGASKYFWAGQIYGGRKGLGFFTTGIKILQKDMIAASSPAQRDLVGLQLSQAYLGMIEIWMTDLCMEPEAEQQCEQLIAEAFLCCEVDPEAWSVLGSIRISQMKHESAKDALNKSWELFATSETVDHSVVPKLVRLAQSMTELRMLEQALEVTTELYRLDDQVPDLYYLNALCHQALALEATGPTERSRHIVGAREAAELLDAVNEEKDPALVEAVKEIINSLPEPEIPNPYEDEDRMMKLE